MSADEILASLERFCARAEGGEMNIMNINTDAIDEAVLGLLYLTRHDKYRAWKGLDWDVLNRLYKKGFIGDPVNKTKSVVFAEEAARV